MRSRLAILALVAGLALLAPGLRASDSLPPEEVPSFELSNWDGRAITKESLRGTTVLVAYTYAKCVVACPMLTFQLHELDSELGSPPDLRYLLVSVNPDEDSAEEIRLHFRKHDIDPVADPRWLFLNGPKRGIVDLLDRAGIEVRFTKVEEGYLIDHTIRVLVLGPEGRTLATFDTYQWDPEEMRHALHLANETR